MRTEKDKLIVKLDFGHRRSSKRIQNQEISANPSKGAQRQRKYREKWKKTEMYRERNAKKCAEYRRSMKDKERSDPNLKEHNKEKERVRKALYRMKKKEQMMTKITTLEDTSADVEYEAYEPMKDPNIKVTERKSMKISKQVPNSKVIQLKKKVKRLQQGKRRIAAMLDTCQKLTTDTPQALRKRAQRVRARLPDSPNKWARTILHVTKNASPRKRQALKTTKKIRHQTSRRQKMVQKKQWREKVVNFLNQESVSRQMPNKRDVIRDEKGTQVAKRHLLLTKKMAYNKFLQEHPLYPYSYTTFRRAIPKHIKKMNLNDRRVCVCMKCFNFTEKMRSVSRIATQHKMEPITLRSIYNDSLCEYEKGSFPNISCVDGSCKLCPQISDKYASILAKEGQTVLKYTQWQHEKTTYLNSKGETVNTKVWKQVEHKETMQSIFKQMCEDMNDMKGHIFRNDYQYFQHNQILDNLPLDHAVVYGDFSQNYAMTPNDEIEAAHYGCPQATLHTWYLIRHARTSTLEAPQLTKEAVVMISDDLKHDTTAVYNFTLKLLWYMDSHPEKINRPTVLHRITDNCGFEYKCKQAFADAQHIEETTGVKIIYHYSEPGHGKGPQDGLGATVKHGLDMLVIRDQVRLSTAYDVYLAATRHFNEVGQNAEPSTKNRYEFSRRKILWVPARFTRKNFQKDADIKPVPGTLKLRFLQSLSHSTVQIANVSCGCSKCLTGKGDSCQYSQWRQTSVCSLRSVGTENTQSKTAQQTKRRQQRRTTVAESACILCCKYVHRYYLPFLSLPLV